MALAAKRSLRDRLDAAWVTTSVAGMVEDETARLFAQQGLPARRTAPQAHSAITFIAAITSSDMLHAKVALSGFLD